MITLTKRRKSIVLAVALLLLIPLIAMQFTAEVNWDLFDFIVMGSLLLGTGLLCDFVLSTVKNKNYQLGLVLLVLAVLFLVWTELAVGIFGSPFAGS